MLLRFLLIFQIFYSVYQDHFKIDTGIPGINVPNLLFLTTLFLILIDSHGPKIVEKARLRTSLLLFMAALVVGFVIAQMRLPQDQMVDFTYLKNALFSPLLYFLYLHSKQDLKNTRLMVIVVVVVAAIASVQAVRQGLDYGLGNFNESRRAAGPFGSDYHNANRAGVYYAMFLPIFIAIALFFRKQWMWRASALVGVGLVAMALLVTYSRQSYFIALFGLAVLLLRRSLVLAAVLGVALISLAGYLPESVTQRVAETRQQNAIGDQEVDESTASRWEIWAGAMQMWTANPMGVGLNRFKTEIGNYSSYVHFDAHNFYVLTLAELGPFGLISLLLLMRALFGLSSFCRRQAPPDDAEAQALAIGFTVATLCMAAGNLYGSPFLEPSVMADYWILCGLLERYFTLRQPQTAVAEVPVAAPVPMSVRFPLAARALPGRRD
jgi:O-antigen ligase